MDYERSKEKLLYQSRKLAINDLIVAHSEEFKELLNKRRHQLGLPDTRLGSDAERIKRLEDKKSKGGCGQPKHAKHCLCDVGGKRAW